MRIAKTRTQLLATGAAIAMSLLVGCATGRPDGNASANAKALPGTPACLFRGNFEGAWQVLNNSTLILYALPNDREAYLVKLFQPVPGLKFNVRLGFLDVQRTGQICGNGNSYVLVPGNAPERILITQVRKLTQGEREQLLAGAGHPSPHRSASRSNASPR